MGQLVGGWTTHLKKNGHNGKSSASSGENKKYFKLSELQPPKQQLLGGSSQIVSG